VRRRDLFWGDFVCLFDRRHAKVGKRLTEQRYFEHEHVLVSFNADLRGIVEDALQKTRKSRCSVSGFANVPAIVEDSALLATVPRLLASDAVARRSHLRWAELPIALSGAMTELLWPSATDDDEACRFVRERVTELAENVAGARRPPARLRSGSRARSRAR
jgi:LysR family transcriptional activator of mexEF-oprN operon